MQTIKPFENYIVRSYCSNLNINQYMIYELTKYKCLFNSTKIVLILFAYKVCCLQTSENTAYVQQKLRLANL